MREACLSASNESMYSVDSEPFWARHPESETSVLHSSDPDLTGSSPIFMSLYHSLRRRHVTWLAQLAFSGLLDVAKATPNAARLYVIFVISQIIRRLDV
jgi:hypothetical protein